MKLGIFGDSFATYGLVDVFDLLDEDKENVWFHKLSDKLNCSCTTHGVAGHSFYGVYKDFLERHNRYDLIVVILTDAQRYTKVHKFDNYSMPSRITSIGMIDHIRKNFKNLTDNDRKYLQHLESFFIMDDGDFRVDMANLMISHMKTLHKNVIFYPAFPLEKFDEVPKEYSLVKIAATQWEHFGVDLFTHGETTKVMAHMIPDNNHAFANVLYDKITKNTYNFSYFDQVNMSQLSRDDFYIKGHI